MTATEISQLSIIADALAAGQLRLAVDGMKQTLEAEPAMRSTDGLARLHREVIQHKGVVARLERDSAARQMTREDERHERARLAAVLLDVLDDMTLIEAKLGIAFRVEAPVADSRPSGPGDTRPRPLGAEPADIEVFLSYARADRAHIVDLAVALQGRGCAAWFDHFITGGARFGEIINARLDARARRWCCGARIQSGRTGCFTRPTAPTRPESSCRCGCQSWHSTACRRLIRPSSISSRTATTTR